jgi:alpha-L-fucosidase 2
MSTSRRDFLRGGLVLAAMPAVSPYLTAAELPAERNQLWHAKAAERWLEAYPVGNGRLAGMVYGGVKGERIAITESTVWSGAPGESDVNPGAKENIGPIRERLFQGKYSEAKELCQKYLPGHGRSFGTNLPMFDLALEMDAEGDAAQYRRVLDLDEGVARVDYSLGGHAFVREIFASNPDDVMVVHLRCDAPKQIGFRAAFANLQLPGDVSVIGGDTLIFRGNAFEKMHSNGKVGVELETRVRVLHDGGTLAVDGSALRVQNANAVTLLVAVGTSFRGGNPEKLCSDALQAASAKSYAQLRAAHVRDHQSLFRRVQIDLGSSAGVSKTPVDERRKALERGADDPELLALFYQYGRYLTIAGSRHNSPLPLALQGIWNDGLASSMGWTDDFHLDINTEQNYWAAESGNLSECQTPLFGFMASLAEAGRKTATEMYGAPGWVAHTITNPWGYTAPGSIGWGIFVCGGVWMARQLWEHYEYAQDANQGAKFLREIAYPVLKSAAEFFLGYMVVHPKYGWLVTGPSDSPENWYVAPDGTRCAESMGPTVDRALVYGLFSSSIESAKALGIDGDFRAKVEAARAKMSPYQIGKHGQLQEWLEDFDEAEPNHRHTSHLIGLYPENQISPDKTPDLAKAARVTLDRRIHAPNWEDTEWSRANLVNYYARLWDGDSAHEHLVGLLAKATEDNLLTYSRGGVAGAAQNIFAIDGNTAGAAGVAEMLLQSQGGEIRLLPALPSKWPQGSVKGLCARGGFEVAMEWAGGRLVLASVSSRRGGECAVRYGGKLIHVTVHPGREARLSAASFA